MKKEPNLEIDSLLDNVKFVEWVMDGKHKLYWSQIINSNPDSANAIQQAKAIVQTIKLSDTHTTSSKTKNEIWHSLDVEITQKSERSFRQRKVYLLALAILIVTATIYIYHKTSQNSGNIETIASNERWIEHTNDSETNWPIDLADGSQVILEPNAYLKYPYAFEQKTRKVLLKGDAFFDIAHDSTKAFYVYANEAVIRVLGTSFFVNAEEDDKEVEVIVKTGKVAVYRSDEVKNYQAKKIKELNPIIVTPNQLATLKKSNLQFNKRLVPTPSLVKSLKVIDKVHFENSSIHEIVLALENAYGVEIEIDENIKETCRLTTTLTNQPLFEKLKIICDPLGLQFQEKNVKIFIKGSCH